MHRSFLLGATRRGRAVRPEVVVGRLAATESALHHSDDQNDGPDSSGVAVVADPSAGVAGWLASQEDGRRLREVADEPTADQRLVLACQVAPDIDGRDFLHRTTPRDKRTEVLVHALNSLGTMEFLAGSADGEKKLERSLRLAEEAKLARRRSLVKPVPDTCFRAHGVRDAQGCAR